MIDVRRWLASNRPHSRVGARAHRVGDRLHVQLRRVWPDQAGPFVAALSDELADLPVGWIDVRLLDCVLVLALDADARDGVEEDVVGAVEAAESRADVACNPFPEHRHGAPVEDEPVLRAAAAVAADVFSFGLSVTLRALRAPRPPFELDVEGLVALVQNVPGLRRTFASWVGRGTAEAAAGVAYALVSGGLAQNVVAPVVGFAYHNLRLGELRARQEAWLAAEPTMYGPGAAGGSSSEAGARPLPRPPGPVERYAEMTWIASLGTFLATIPLTGSVDRALGVLASGAPKAARIGREAFGSHLSRDLGERGIVVLRPGSLRLLDQIDVVVVEGRLWAGDDAARLQRVAAANGLEVVVVGAPPRRRSGSTAAPVIPVVPAAEGPAEIRRLQIAGRVVATVGGPGFGPLAAGDLPIGVAGPDGRSPDGSHVICLGGLPDALRILNACLPARQASRESAHLSLAGALAGVLVAMAPAVGTRMPRVLTVVDTAALVAVGNAVRLARQAERCGAGHDPASPQDASAPISLSPPTSRKNGQEAALA
ncbi:MAG TPA: hypothetical protein VEG38_09150 [Acidimicrobiia bacterium]|nr:hypothetical protein [Acidimicrobiia bacterium]